MSNIYTTIAVENQEIIATGTIFRSVKHQHPESVVVEQWQDFVAMLRTFHDRLLPSKEDNKLFCPAWFGDRPRATRHVVDCGVLGFDYDDGTLTPSVFLDRFRDSPSSSIPVIPAIRIS
jgi:hypothetical protein